MKKIAAGIILYNPDIKRLSENINAIINQVEKIILVDNNSKNFNLIYEIFGQCDKVIIISNSQNLGVAKALNQIVIECHSLGYEWVLTLDQDSVCSDNMLTIYSKYTDMENIAIICPKITDRNTSHQSKDLENRDFEFVEECITSASLVSIPHCIELGLFDEKMFIDLVDFEFCYRVIKSNLYILKTNETTLLHQLGDIKQYHIGKFHINVTNHSPIRRFYYFRNCLYFMRKHKNLKLKYRLSRKMSLKIFHVIFFEKEKRKKISAIARGIIAGFKIV